jgi:starch synthase
LPSRHEGFPVAVLEAMACALPVVAADISGVRDLLQASPDREAGAIVRSGDAGALADALGRLIDDENLSRELGSSARSVAENFSLEDVGTQLADVLLRNG